jgi:IS30 family transposase
LKILTAAPRRPRRTGRRVLVEAGGVRPRRGRGLRGRCLSFGEREEIAVGREAGESMRSIADRLGRSASTISRELERNLDRQGRYRATALVPSVGTKTSSRTTLYVVLCTT